MSVEEDVELKNLVAQTLENSGILPRIRAELRANVFKALEENLDTRETLLKNKELSAFLKFPLSALILNLIRDFLEVFELEFTLSVFDSETMYGKEYENLSKEKLLKELKMSDYKKKNSVLCEVIERFIYQNEPKNTSNRLLNCSGDSFISPIPHFNATYVKNGPEVDDSPVEKDEVESIKEEIVSSNVSESDSLGDQKANITLENAADSPESDLNSPVPKNALDIDLLTFTPVKETKAKEKFKTSTPGINNEEKTDEKKEMTNILTTLKDLPPLTSQVKENKNHINDIKAIIDKWPDSENDEEPSLSKSSKNKSNHDEKISVPLKSDRSDQSQLSGKTETPDDFEEDISDLLNHHTNSDNQLAVDETASKTNEVPEHLESL